MIIEIYLNSTLEYVQQNIPALNNETSNDFKLKNQSKTHIKNPLNINMKCVLLSEAQTFFPLLEVSRVGFNSDTTQALVYVGRTDVPLAGGGYYHVLRRRYNKWKIIGIVMTWIS